MRDSCRVQRAAALREGAHARVRRPFFPAFAPRPPPTSTSQPPFLSFSFPQIYDLETTYLTADYTAPGAVTKGLDGYLSTKDPTRKRAGGGGGGGGGGGAPGGPGSGVGPSGVRVDDRLFSLSSASSPAAVELEQSALEEAAAAAPAPTGRAGKSYASKGGSKGRRPSQG
jgi:hypothetical protein